jgi:hypothetical protein
MTMPITYHIKNTTSSHLLSISAADSLKETRAMYRTDDLIKIILIYF